MIWTGPSRRSDVIASVGEELEELEPLQQQLGVLVVGDPILGNRRARIAELAISHRLPTSGTHRGCAEGGLLMSYGTDFVELFRHGAVLVDKILKGA
jgi:hypothetical protein